mgnify:CR=1 FL=1
MTDELDPMESQKRADRLFREQSERSMQGVSWSPPPPKPPPATEWERLLLQADALDREARGYIGCSWTGDRHPSSGLRAQAASLRRAAAILKASMAQAAPVPDKGQHE